MAVFFFQRKIEYYLCVNEKLVAFYMYMQLKMLPWKDCAPTMSDKVGFITQDLI